MFATTIFGHAIAAIWLFMYLVAYIIFAIWPAMVAKGKGYSAILFYVLSLFFFIFALILAYILPNKNVPKAPAPEAKTE